MAYCEIADVSALNPQRTYNPSSKPTSAQVVELISKVSAEIDSILLGRGYSTPVSTPTEFVTYLKSVNAHGAAALAEMGMFPEASGVAATPHGELLWKLYKDMCTFLREGSLPSAQWVSPRSFFEQHEGEEEEPSTTEVPEWQKPKFGKEKIF